MYSASNFFYFGVIWLTWSFLCTLFLRFNGRVSTVTRHACVISAYLLLTGVLPLGG